MPKQKPTAKKSGSEQALANMPQKLITKFLFFGDSLSDTGLKNREPLMSMLTGTNKSPVGTFSNYYQDLR